MSEPIQHNAQDLEQELAWLTRVIDTRFKLYFGQESEVEDVFDLPPPDLEGSKSYYGHIVNHYQMAFAERLCLILALAPHIRPRLLDVFYTKNKTFDRKFTEFGGIREGSEGDFFPTGETLVFLLAGHGLEIRFALQPILGRDHFFTRHNILNLETSEAGHSPLKAPLRLTEEYLSYFTTGEAHRPHFSLHFPARYIETQLEWKELVLHPGTLAMVKEIESWINHGDTLLHDWQMAGKIRPGYRALFYGPPGTGKTMTACLLGKSTGHEVYRVDLSTVISKYIGETEKNLARVFDMAENKQWILFFDEADALFGKRSETKDAHDRYANQEVSYLLQRIESFNGIAILASNMKENVDKAFTRRFESIIYFPMPGPRERRQLWEQGFSAKARLAEDIALDQLAQKFELSGGMIMNVIRFASLQALERGDNMIYLNDLLQGIKRELAKEGRMG
ncbi:MAG: ATP-binding protein [Lewinellaceae bacterium]|nr:ATP-binding protein [Phaeodactylibacter sp.]MCB9037303.1 ATP-binding protein [Lewinellaceae bacterium]